MSSVAFQMMRKISDILSASPRGGSGLVMDYGKDGPSTDTFRAFKNHKQVDVFHRPGECDLTADVDFNWLRHATEGLGVSFLPFTLPPSSSITDIICSAPNRNPVAGVIP